MIQDDSGDSDSAVPRAPAVRRRSKSDAKRQRILDAAAKVFREKGYAGARLSDIAAAANTQAGSLYYHFESRDALVRAVLDVGVENAFSAVAAGVEALGPRAGPRERLIAAIKVHIETNLEQDNYLSANARIFGQVPLAIREPHLQKQRAYGDFWRQLLAEAGQAGLMRPDLDPSASRMLILGMLNWCVEWYRPGRLSAAEIAALAADILMDGLMKAAPGEAPENLAADDQAPGGGSA